MKKRLLPIFAALMFLYCGANAQADTVLSRYKQYLLNTVKPEGNLKELMTTLNAKGQWPDINYQDAEKANWKNLLHLKRLRDLALVWARPGSFYFQDLKLRSLIHSGLNHWLVKRYKNSNWWHNEIGVPGYMRDLIILLRDELNAAELKGAMEVLGQHQIRENWVGANLTWSADLGFHYAALNNDAKRMEFCRNLIVKEIKISTDEGVQPDFSFHQHGPRLQMYQYGRAFLWENVRLAWELRGTTLAFPEEKIRILNGFVLKGWQWMARGIHTVPGTMDRSASRLDALKSADLVGLIPYFIALSPEHKNEFNRLLTIQSGKAALSGHRHYPYSDFTVHHNNDFSFFLKTISSRTLATESINNENLKGNLLNSGDAYLISTGKEYFNLMPVWDWAYLPGVTAFNGAYKINRRPFTGGVSDGEAGLTVMDYQLEDKDKGKMISVRKFWAIAGKEVLCLMAGMQGTGITDAYTALDQCRWTGDVTVNEKGNVLSAGTHELARVSWIHHAGFAYIPLKPVEMQVKLADVTGSWKEINASETNAPVTEKVFLPIIRHHNLKEESASGYLLVGCKTPKEAARLVSSRDWKVLHNDRELQAVQLKGGALMAAFYQPGTLDTQTAFGKLATDSPCLVLLRKGELWLSNPAGLAIRISLKLNQKQYKVDLPGDGSAVKLDI